MKKNLKKNEQSTFDRFMKNSKEKERYQQEYQVLLLSELLLASMEEDCISVRKLAKAAGVSPSIVQGLRTGVKTNINLNTFKKIVGAMGYNICLEKGNRKIII